MRRNLTVALVWLAGLFLIAPLVAQDKGRQQPIRLKVIVPEKANLEIDGVKTKSVGPVRYFISPPVQAGKTYTYVLTATWTEGDRFELAEHTVEVKAGDDVTIELTKFRLRVPDRIFVPTPQDVVEKMLEMAEVKQNDVVYDLGCGDGRIVVTAAKKYGCKAVGFDIDPKRVKESIDNVRQNNVGDLVTIKQEDIFTLDLSPASVVTLYLLPDLNVKLIPQLEKLKPGSRIVSHDFDMKGVKQKQVVKITGKEIEREHTIYLWVTPLEKE